VRIQNLVSLVGGVVFTAVAAAGSLKETYWLEDRGILSKFEIARDEAHSDRVARRIPQQGSADALRRILQGQNASDLVLYPAGSPHIDANRCLLTRQIAVHLRENADTARLAAAGVKVLKSMGRKRTWWLVESGPEPGSALEAAEALRRVPGVLAVEPQLARQQQKRAIPNDPFFSRQWHLDNTGQSGGEPAIDINVMNVWDTYRGSGVVIGIVDDGLEKSHPDLAPNYNAALSFDFNFNDTNPEPPSFSGDDHGTSCAGVAAARGNNGLGVTGAAFESTLAGLRLISRPTTDADEADAFEFHLADIDIKSNSWGPTDNGKVLERPGPLTRSAFEDSVAAGRGGLGTIIVWAGGNGLDSDDNSNYDGYANAPETIAVGAITNEGEQAYYSESGANIVVVAPSSGGTLDICTTDREGRDGYNDGNFSFDLDDSDYTETFGGTSSACPLVAGSVALMLQANPNLGWRDVQEILLRSARMVRPLDSDWATNAAGFHFNHKFGAGLIDAGAAVALAESWVNLGLRSSAVRQEFYAKRIIPDDNPAGLDQSFTFAESMRVEHVCVTVDIRHGSRGQIEIEVESPSGMISQIAPGRSRDRHDNYRDWRFMSVRHWGENSVGTWHVRVRDTHRRVVGTLRSLKVELFGAALP
jgi:subtilisin-like proprotein convertase family protein